ncbi:serine/arginine-rich splicing factor RS41-like isoform X1 [Phragmites australis]|uniref:serine/arginine-rich splicing factor RS41-like isoform X1 n=2 Tax=Phragmites australis TaxID=29695 RepID=UPI002D76E538|nr:serine/arginine-rich splicing factor RS41-like isoform X1 [Phragmites australis]
MRPIFCGNLDYDVRISEIERLFGKYGRVERVDLKTGFAFVYMEDERDADDAIHRLDGIDFGRKGRRIRVEWTKEDRSAGRRGSSRRSPNNARPTKTLFVINFDPMNTRTRDLERHFDKYGRIANVRIKKNFAFVQFELQEDATRALEGTNGSTLMDRVISVEYALRDDDERGNGYSPDRRGRERSPGRRRSPSPYGRVRERGSPDYGRGMERGSPDYGRGGDRRSPDYGRGASPNGGGRGDDRGSPNYDRERREASPRRERREASPGYDRPLSRSPARD